MTNFQAFSIKTLTKIVIASMSYVGRTKEEHDEEH